MGSAPVLGFSGMEPSENDEPLPERPRTRGECLGGPRPCPWVGCRHHLYLDVSKAGGLKFVWPGIEPEGLADSCALDVADRGAHTLEATGACLNVTRERVRQIETRAIQRVETRTRRFDYEDD